MLTLAVKAAVQLRLAAVPAVVLLGPGQVCKTTLAQAAAATQAGAVMLHLERETDRAGIAQPDLFFPRFLDRLVVLDEVQHVLAHFQVLRPEIDGTGSPAASCCWTRRRASCCGNPASRRPAAWPISS